MNSLSLIYFNIVYRLAYRLAFGSHVSLGVALKFLIITTITITMNMSSSSQMYMPTARKASVQIVTN